MKRRVPKIVGNELKCHDFPSKGDSIGYTWPNTPMAVGCIQREGQNRGKLETRSDHKTGTHGVDLHSKQGIPEPSGVLIRFGCEIGRGIGCDRHGSCSKIRKKGDLPGWSNDKQSAVLNVVAHSVCFPVSCHAVIEIVVFSKPQFDGI